MSAEGQTDGLIVSAALVDHPQLNALVDAAGLAVVISDLDVHITGWSDAAAQLYGWTASEITGQHASVLWPQHKLTAADDDAHESVLAGEALDIRAWRVRKDGSLFLAEVHTIPLIDDAGELIGTMALVRHAGQEHQLAERAAATEQRFTSAFHGAGLPMVICELDGAIIDRNDAYRGLVRCAGLTDDVRLFDLIEPVFRPQVASAVATLATDRSRFGGIEVAMTGNTDHILSLSVSPVENGPDLPPLALVQLIDVSDQLRLQAELAEIARFDPLTGAFNRSCLDPLLRSIPANTDVALLFLDLDSFKSINDAHGHAAGDTILESVGARLNAVVRDSDYVVRYGGDEFIVVCPGLGDPGAARRLGDRLRASVAMPISSDGTLISVTASIGVQITTVRPESQPTDFVRQADIALYEAKDQGRNTTVIASQTARTNSAT